VRIGSRSIVIILVIAVLIGGLGLAAARLTMVVVPSVGGTYVEGVTGNVRAINPILCQYNQVDQDLVALVFNGLTTTDSRGVIIPDLAERWEISEDGLRYTFHLRQGVHWHDGAPFTSTDVKFTIQAMQDPNYQGPPELSNLWQPIQVDTPDPHTVVFTLPEPFSPFLEYTTQRLLPSHVLSTVAPELLPSSQFNAQPVGTGPYRVIDTTARHVTLEANREYHGPRPYIERIQFVFYPDQASLFAAHQRGEVSGIGQVLPEDLDQVRKDHSLNLYSAPYAGYTMIFLNLKRAIFQDAAVRRALWQAIDRQGLVDRHLSGQGIVIHGPILPNSWAYDPDLPPVTYDPQAAARALDAAGWRLDGGTGTRSKDGERLEFTLLTNADDPVRQQMIEDIARQWAEIGVSAKTSAIDMTELVSEHLYKRDYDAVLYGWDLPAADPDPYPLWHSSQAGDDGQNYVSYADADSDRLLEQARRTADYGQRIALYRDLQRRFVEQAPALLLYQPIYNYAVDRQVQGVQIPPLLTTGDRFHSVANWYIATRRLLLSKASAALQRKPAPPVDATGQQ
jgi:peptide/nickel transport system substrate-binding protein